METTGLRQLHGLRDFRRNQGDYFGSYAFSSFYVSPAAAASPTATPAPASNTNTYILG